MGMIQSLNISVACAVSIYEAMRQKREAGHYAQSSLEAFEQEALLQYWNINLPE
jgi:tRNA (guanosine-2'-O-)-methyltransferase